MSDLDRVSPGRLRVFISAYAFGPDHGPEAQAGWAFAVAATRDHDVWVVTRPRFEPAVSEALRADPVLAERLHVSYLDLSDRLTAIKKRNIDIYWYYMLWQRSLGRRAQALHDEIGFDVVHHLTFANDWMPCGVAQVRDVPLVWGPVGGASQVPLRRVGRWLGPRGLATELLRIVLTGSLRRLWGDPTAARAALVVAQNNDVARRFARSRRVVVEPNAALELEQVTTAGVARPADGLRHALFVGRLLAWKGPRLAIETLAHPAAQDWRLTIYGEGHQRAALERLTVRLGLADRVEFAGHRPRAEVLSAYLDADAFLFPSLHDQAGWVAAEASSLGCPVVCLPLGGPPILAGPNAFIASMEGDIVSNLAEQLRQAGSSRGVPHSLWSRDRLPDVVAGWYTLARETSAR